MVGPFSVLLPEGCFPDSVSDRWFPSLSFSTKPFVVTEVVPKNCYCYTFRRCTVIGNSTTEVVALPVPQFPKVLWQSFAEAPDFSAGEGTYRIRKLRISLIASLVLSPGFVTNTLLSLSRPVGKGPGRLPKKSSTTPGGAAPHLSCLQDL